jgi:hypothetical protein
MCLQKFCFGSGSALEPNLMIFLIRIGLKFWIRGKSIRIHSPTFGTTIQIKRIQMQGGAGPITN